jgi:hypothetical protein
LEKGAIAVGIASLALFAMARATAPAEIAEPVAASEESTR